MKEDIKYLNKLKQRRVIRTRSNIFGTAQKPRLAIYKSLKSISVQAIDDSLGKTLAAASDIKIKKGTRKEKAAEVGRQIAKLLLEQKITEAVFDKRHYQYHGLIKQVAESAREGGLKF